MNKAIQCKGKLLSLYKPVLMGILNLTPDSFYDGGQHNILSHALRQTEKMLQEGADIVDIGALSTRPKAELITEEEELKRLDYIVREISKKFPDAILSIDTFRSKVAKEMIGLGASIVNDISGGSLDQNMFKTVASLNCPYVLMHMKGVFSSMHQTYEYKNIVTDVIEDLSSKINKLIDLNVADIIVDPGFGFSKNKEQNYELLKGLDVMCKISQRPILVGVSRKSMIWKSLDIEVKNALNATTALNMFALTQGANILRVHDVKEAKETIKLFNMIQGL